MSLQTTYLCSKVDTTPDDPDDLEDLRICPLKNLKALGLFRIPFFLNPVAPTLTLEVAQG
jgi:hypothetical protein